MRCFTLVNPRWKEATLGRGWVRAPGSLTQPPPHSRFPSVEKATEATCTVQRLGIRVSGLSFGYQVSGFGSQVSGFGSRVSGLGFRVSGFGFRVSGFGFRVSGLGFRVLGSVFRVSCNLDRVDELHLLLARHLFFFNTLEPRVE